MSVAPPADDRQYPWKRQDYEDLQNFPHAADVNGNNGDYGQEKPPRPPPPVPERPPASSPQHADGKKSSAARRAAPPSCLFAFLGTRQVAEHLGRETYIRVTIRELLIYMFYLGIVCFVTFGTTSTTSYFFTKKMLELFVDRPFDNKTERTFRESVTLDDFWDFVQGSLVEGLYQEFLYSSGLPSTNIVTKNGILFENRLLGVPRLRQIRVRPDSCEISPSFRRLVRQCYSSYRTDIVDTTRNWKPGPYTGTPWTYKPKAGWSSWGKLGWYGRGGSYLDFHVDSQEKPPPPGYNAKDETVKDLQFLKDNHWLSRASRVVFLDFTVYNANLNLFCLVKLVWELPATGGVVPSWFIQTSTLIRYANWFDSRVIFSFEILFCCFTLYYILQEVYEISYEGCAEYMKDIWTYVDWSILLERTQPILSLYNFCTTRCRKLLIDSFKSPYHLSITCVGLSVVKYIHVNEFLIKVKPAKAVFYDFGYLALLQYVYQSLLAVLVFVSWIKVFKYMAFNKTMTQLSTTLSRCAADVGGFAIMFFIVFAAFAQLGLLMFGTQVQDFSTFSDACFTLLRLILGDFNFRQIEAANRVLGPIYFVAYVFFVFFVLLNMFLAIINDTFGEVKAEVQSQRNEFEIIDYFKRGFNNLCGLCGKKDPELDAKYAVKLASADGLITYEELRQNLKDHNFTDVEVEMFLARYELDRHRALDEDEIQHVLAELEGSKLSHSGKGSIPAYQPGMRSSHSEYISNQVYEQEIEGLQNRVATMEASLSNMIYKLDSIAGKVERLKH